MNAVDFSAAARAEYATAKRWWRWLLAGQILGLAFAAITAMAPTSGVTFGGGVISLLSVAGVYWCKKEADETYERGESWRRLALLRDALGVGGEAGELSRLQAEATTEMSDDPGPAGNYYNSTHQQGPQRLAQILWESAHFTGQLAKRTAALAGWAAAGGVVLVLLAFFIMLEAPTLTPRPSAFVEWGPRVGGAGVAMLGVFGVGILGDLWRNFRSLTATADSVAKRCEGLLRQPDLQLCELLGVLGDYNAAVARAAPIPSFVWRPLQKKITASWTAVNQPPLPGVARENP